MCALEGREPKYRVGFACALFLLSARLSRCFARTTQNRHPRLHILLPVGCREGETQLALASVERERDAAILRFEELTDSIGTSFRRWRSLQKTNPPAKPPTNLKRRPLGSVHTSKRRAVACESTFMASRASSMPIFTRRVHSELRLPREAPAQCPSTSGDWPL